MSTLIWQPQGVAIEEADLLDRIAGLTYEGRQPFDPASLDMLGALSRTILQDPISRQSPQYVALAFWLRPASLARLVEELSASGQAGSLIVPRGVALHLPPNNVDTIFVYSWAMSVLAGNANIVRLSESLSPATAWLVATVARVVATHGDAGRQIFCHYEYGGALDGRIASHCDLRTVWGGDDKVRTVSKTPIRPDGLSIGFPDRKSLSILAASAYREADDMTREALATNLFNDIYWFDQMGCGSPRLLAWFGEPAELADDLHRRLGGIIATRGYRVETATAISKLAQGHDLLAGARASSYRRYSNELDVSVTDQPAALLQTSQGGGFLGQWVTSDLDNVAAIVTRNVQTATHFGLSEAELERLAQSMLGRGCYRIVPIGQALKFDPTWDGIDLFSHMTRKVVIRR